MDAAAPLAELVGAALPRILGARRPARGGGAAAARRRRCRRSARRRHGVCPFCGAPPGFADVVEGGHRRLACHFCGGAWGFAKLRCPLCGVEGSKDLQRLQAEGEDAGYVISGCRACRGYLKELDRRERWNGGPPLLGDWASPPPDVLARRGGLRKPPPALLRPAPAP